MALNQNFTVKNNLNTLGSILSSGVDISTSFSPSSLYTLVGSNSASWSGGGNVATTVQSQSANNSSVYNQVSSLSANWNSAYNTATTYQNASGSFATNTFLQSTSALLTPLTTTNTLTGQLVLNTSINSLTGNWNSAYASTTALNLSSGNWQNTYVTVNTLSGSWVGGNTAYTNLVSNSATYLAVTSVSGTPSQISTSTSNGVVTLSLPNSIITPGNLTVGGNLYVTGSSVQVNQTTLNIADPVIYLSEDNPGDAYDIGFVGHNVVGGVYGHTGLLRTHGIGNPGTWYLFSSMSTEPSGNTVSSNSKTIDTLVANISGSVIGNFQQVPANSVIGNPTGSTANSQAIPTSTIGLALLSATSASAAATTLGLGSTSIATFSAVNITNGSQTTNSNIFYGTTITNVLTIPTFNKTTYNTVKYVVQIKRSGGASAALEILVNYNTGNTTWEGTVYGLLDSGSIFTNVDVATTGATIDLAFTLNGNATYNITVIGQAI